MPTGAKLASLRKMDEGEQTVLKSYTYPFLLSNELVQYKKNIVFYGNYIATAPPNGSYSL